MTPQNAPCSSFQLDPFFNYYHLGYLTIELYVSPLVCQKQATVNNERERRIQSEAEKKKKKKETE
jgi:hypothetical protein